MAGRDLLRRALLPLIRGTIDRQVDDSLKLMTVLTPCFNEQQNVRNLGQRVGAAAQAAGVAWFHMFVDNASSDGTIAEIRAAASGDRSVRLIVNQRNFGHVRSRFMGCCRLREMR